MRPNNDNDDDDDNNDCGYFSCSEQLSLDYNTTRVSVATDLRAVADRSATVKGDALSWSHC